MKWIKASERLGKFEDSDIPEWKFFHPDFCKIDNKPAARPFFRKDIEKNIIIFSYTKIAGSNFSTEITESDFDRIEWLDENIDAEGGKDEHITILSDRHKASFELTPKEAAAPSMEEEVGQLLYPLELNEIVLEFKAWLESMKPHVKKSIHSQIDKKINELEKYQFAAPSIAVEEKEWEKEFRYMQRLNYDGQKILDEVRKEFEDYKNKYPAASPKEEKKY